MKTLGRRTGAAYELYGFIPKFENGKHSAICMSCNRILQNTAAVRLRKHRNACDAALASNGDPAHFLYSEAKKRTSKTGAVEEGENVFSNVKVKQSNMDFGDENINDNATYEDAVDKRTSKTDAVEEGENVFSNVKVEQSNMDFGDENINDNATYEDAVENLQDYVPSRQYTTKKDRIDDKLKAKIKYFKERSKYFISEMNNLKFEKTMMVLQVKKLRLEIQQLEVV